MPFKLATIYKFFSKESKVVSYLSGSSGTPSSTAYSDAKSHRAKIKSDLIF